MYRKSRTRGSYKPSGRRFSRSRLRTVQPTQRWSRANFFVQQETLHTEQNSYQNVVLVLAQLDGHIGDPTVPTGRTLNSLARTLDIGGIVFDWRMTAVPDINAGAETGASFAELRMEQQLLLCTDRLDDQTLVGPVAIDVNWFTNTSPIVAAQSNQPDDQDSKFPTRVHWRTYRCSDDSERIAVNTTATAEPQHFRSSGAVVLAQGSKNLRLRVRLRDTDCLVFHWATIASSLNDALVNAYYPRCTIAGSLYYRVSF